MKSKFELAIIGAGIAGVSAAIYAKRSGLDFVIFESKAVGGQLLFMEGIDNYAGIPLGTKGSDLANELSQTLKSLQIEVVDNEIDRVAVEKNIVNLYTQDAVYSVKGLIIASGASFRKLGISDEDNFLGRGISYCAVCDGFFFKGKDVVVVGGGNTALEEALYLSEIASKVTLIHRRDKLRGLDYLQQELFKKDNIEIVFNSTIKEIKGIDVLEEIIIEDVGDKSKRSLTLKGLFIAIGIEATTKIFKNLISMDQGSFIVTDGHMKTSCDSIWAAGDCRKRPLRQLVTAASEGAIASMSVYKYLRGHYISV